jgi:hypothetical protein
VAVLTIPVGDALGAIGTCPTIPAQAGVRHHAEAVFLVAAFPADGLLTGGALVTVVAGTLERFVDAPAVYATGPGLADRAVGSAPARFADTHPRHDTLAVKTSSLTNRFIAEHPVPPGLAAALEAAVAVAVQAAWKADAFIAKLSGPSDFAFAGERSRTITVNATLSVDVANRSFAEMRLFAPPRQTMDFSVLVAKEVSRMFDVFGSTGVLDPTVERSDDGRVGTNDCDDNDAEKQQGGAFQRHCVFPEFVRLLLNNSS